MSHLTMRRLERKTEFSLECETFHGNDVPGQDFLRQQFVRSNRTRTRIKGSGRCWKRCVYPLNRSTNEVGRMFPSNTRADVLPRIVSHVVLETTSSLTVIPKTTVP